jgi:hypothetical protein
MKKLFLVIMMVCCCTKWTGEPQNSKAAELLVLETIDFAGRTWDVKSGYCSIGNTAGPGPNYWCGDEEDLWIDGQGRLHMRINYKSSLSAYGCVSIKTLVSGCGVYRYTVTDGPSGTPDSFDKNVVLGLFTYETNATYDNYEIDVEISDWGDPTPNANLWFSTWQDETPTSDDFLVEFGTGAVEHTFVWQPSAILFTSTKDDVLIGDGVRTGSDVYPCPTEPIYARINFWLMSGLSPSSEQEVVIGDFEFTPFILLNAPTGLSVTVTGDTTIELDWIDTSAGESGYQIERKESGGSYSIIETTDSNETEYEDTSLSAGTTYVYRLAATGGDSYSDYSDEEQATTTGGSDAGSTEPSLSEIDFDCAGWNGYVEGTIDDMPEGSWHVRTWVLTNKYYPQGKDLDPEQSGAFYATHGLWCTPGPNVYIYVTMHLASTDECGTGDCDQVETNDWPDEVDPDYVFGPFETQ